jgi:hypothetical protein
MRREHRRQSQFLRSSVCSVFPSVLLVLFSFHIFLLSASGSSTLRGSEQRVREKKKGCCVGVHPSGPISTNTLYNK